MQVNMIADKPILNELVPTAPTAGKSCLAIDAPPWTQTMDNKAAETALLVFFIDKIINKR